MEVTTGGAAAESVFLNERERALSFGGTEEQYFNGGSDTRRDLRQCFRERVEGSGGKITHESGCKMIAEYPPNELFYLTCIMRHEEAKKRNAE